MPDLRFLIGALLATALLGVATFGLGAAVHLVHQSKVGPLEGSRMLAFAPLDVRNAAIPMDLADSAFAGVPVSPNGMRPPALQQQTQADLPAETTASPASDPDTVDERAVVDPPLPPDIDPVATESGAEPPVTEPAGAAGPLAPSPSAATAQAIESNPPAAASTAGGSPLAPPATPTQTIESNPPAAAESAAAPAVEIPPAPAPIAEIPEVVAPSTEAPPASVAQTPSETPGDVEAVGSLPAAATPLAAQPRPRRAAPKRKQASHQAAPKATPKAAPRARHRARSALARPSASTGYAVPGPFADAPARNSAKGLWWGD